MKDFDSNKALAWLSIIIIAVSSVVTFSKLFSTVESHEGRLLKIEEKDDKRIIEQKVRDDAQRDRDDTLRDKLGKIQESVNFMNWRMDSVTKQLEKIDEPRTVSNPVGNPGRGRGAR